MRQKRPSVYLKGSGAEINLISTDLNTCKKSTNTTEPACRPNLFSLYTNPISSIIHSQSSINHHFYADNTQLYITLTPTNFSHSIQKLKNCLSDIQNFMSANKLKLNPDKTEFILIGSKNNRKQLLPHFPINILGNQVSPAQSVRNLQNSLCRVVTRSSKYCHITPQLKTLHWLPIKYRIQFKIGLITYKTLNQGEPVYLRELIHPYTSSRNTRRSTPKLKFLHTPTFDCKVHKSVKHFSNSFSHYAPVLWNSFPFQIRNSPSVTSFRKHLKTHLFNSSFPT